ncbi:PREDICTED: uncharacterized protein LOC108771385 [Cyphomyrmex costatus]|uniref:uncharacterized protein LOC108771385 n=1 Tax=Cyphomyrmex costatus TaxID=456900 RepID=UPI000852462D|nr:PREDICTED: uncharacterized protein LOC108771385 [Cyphomyrmex costatus]
MDNQSANSDSSNKRDRERELIDIIENRAKKRKNNESREGRIQMMEDFINNMSSDTSDSETDDEQERPEDRMKTAIQKYIAADKRTKSTYVKKVMSNHRGEPICQIYSMIQVKDLSSNEKATKRPNYRVTIDVMDNNIKHYISELTTEHAQILDQSNRRSTMFFKEIQSTKPIVDTTKVSTQSVVKVPEPQQKVQTIAPSASTNTTDDITGSAESISETNTRAINPTTTGHIPGNLPGVVPFF